MKNTKLKTGIGVALLALCGGAHGQITLQSQGASVPFTSLQCAVDAALPGDRITVAGPGPHRGFSCNKGIEVVSLNANTVLIPRFTQLASCNTPSFPTLGSIVRVAGVPAGQQVWIRGFRLTSSQQPSPQGAMEVLNNRGSVVLDDVRVASGSHSGAALTVTSSDSVVVADCLFGAPNFGTPTGTDCVVLTDSTVQMQDTWADGGEGRTGSTIGGLDPASRGGHAVVTKDTHLSLHGCHLTGGKGGGHKAQLGNARPGGDALRVEQTQIDTYSVVAAAGTRLTGGDRGQNASSVYGEYGAPVFLGSVAFSKEVLIDDTVDLIRFNTVESCGTYTLPSNQPCGTCKPDCADSFPHLTSSSGVSASAQWIVVTMNGDPNELFVLMMSGGTDAWFNIGISRVPLLLTQPTVFLGNFQAGAQGGVQWSTQIPLPISPALSGAPLVFQAYAATFGEFTEPAIEWLQ